MMFPCVVVFGYSDVVVQWCVMICVSAGGVVVGVVDGSCVVVGCGILCDGC